MRYLTSLILVSGLAIGCKGEVSNPPAPDIVAEGETIELIATSQILPPEKIVKASIAPKSGFMASLGHILLLSETGSVYSSNTGFGTITKVTEGDYVDILGLNLGDDGPSMFLALDTSGSIKAFAENKRDGFDLINISADDLKADAFCQSETTRENQLQLSVPGKLRKLNFNLNSDLLELSTAEEIESGEISGCFENVKGQVFISGKTKNFRSLGDEVPSLPGGITQITTISEGLNVLQGAEGQLYAQTADLYAPIQVKSGFSILGVDRADWIISTNSPMGNTFMGGLTLIADSSENRIAMISNDYIRKTIIDQNVEPSP